MNTVNHLRLSFLQKAREGGFWNLDPSIKALHNQGLSFQNQDTFFVFQKEQGRSPLSSLVQRMQVWLNFHQYP